MISPKIVIERKGDFKSLYDALNALLMDAEFSSNNMLLSENALDVLFEIDGGTYKPDAFIVMDDELKAKVVFDSFQLNLLPHQ